MILNWWFWPSLIHSSLLQQLRALFLSQGRSKCPLVRNFWYLPWLKRSWMAVDLHLSRTVFQSRQVSRCWFHSFSQIDGSYQTRYASRHPPGCTNAQHQMAKSCLFRVRNDLHWNSQNIDCMYNSARHQIVGMVSRCRLDSSYSPLHYL